MSPTLTATLAGSRDRQLEELMQTCGLRVAVSKVEELARYLGKGPPLSHVQKVEVMWRPVTGRFQSFGIRYAEFDS